MIFHHLICQRVNIILYVRIFNSRKTRLGTREDQLMGLQWRVAHPTTVTQSTNWLEQIIFIPQTYPGFCSHKTTAHRKKPRIVFSDSVSGTLWRHVSQGASLRHRGPLYQIPAVKLFMFLIQRLHRTVSVNTAVAFLIVLLLVSLLCQINTRSLPD